MKKIDYERLAAIYKTQLQTPDETKRQYIKVLILETAHALHVDELAFIKACGLE